MTTIISHSFTHKERSSTTDVKLISLITPDKNKKKVFKFTYENYNAGERFYGELFNGNNLGPIFSIRDLGVMANSSNYCIMTEAEVKKRIEDLTKKGIEFINLLY